MTDRNSFGFLLNRAVIGASYERRPAQPPSPSSSAPPSDAAATLHQDETPCAIDLATEADRMVAECSRANGKSLISRIDAMKALRANLPDCASCTVACAPPNPAGSIATQVHQSLHPVAAQSEQQPSVPATEPSQSWPC